MVGVAVGERWWSSARAWCVALPADLLGVAGELHQREDERDQRDQEQAADERDGAAPARRRGDRGADVGAALQAPLLLRVRLAPQRGQRRVSVAEGGGVSTAVTGAAPGAPRAGRRSSAAAGRPRHGGRWPRSPACPPAWLFALGLRGLRLVGRRRGRVRCGLRFGRVRFAARLGSGASAAGVGSAVFVAGIGSAVSVAGFASVASAAGLAAARGLRGARFAGLRGLLARFGLARAAAVAGAGGAASSGSAAGSRPSKAPASRHGRARRAAPPAEGGRLVGRQPLARHRRGRLLRSSSATARAGRGPPAQRTLAGRARPPGASRSRVPAAAPLGGALGARLLVERRAAARAEVGVAGVQLAALGAGAADPGLAQQRLVRLAEPRLERPHLGVERRDPLRLGGGEPPLRLLRRATGAAMDLVREAAQVAQQELAHVAQVAQAPPQLAAAGAGRRGGGEVGRVDAGRQVARGRAGCAA